VPYAALTDKQYVPCGITGAGITGAKGASGMTPRSADMLIDHHDQQRHAGGSKKGGESWFCHSMLLDKRRVIFTGESPGLRWVCAGGRSSRSRMPTLPFGTDL